MKRKIKRYYSDGKAKGHFNLDENSYINVCDIISSITDTSLALQFSGSGSYTDGKTINVPVMMPFSATHLPDEMTHYTFLEHELAHILFETDVRNFDLFMEWFTKYSDNYLDAYFFSNNFDDKQIDEFWREWGIIDWSTILRRIFDRVECHRVEHNWGEVYPGSRIRFKELRKGLGKTHTEEELNEQIILYQNLSNTLLISRIYKDDILTKTATPSFLNTHENVVFCVERLTNVENQSSIATLIECKSIIKRWMPMLFLDMISLMKKDIPISECSMTDPNQYTDEFDSNFDDVCISVCGKPSPIDVQGGSNTRIDHSHPRDDNDVMNGCHTKKLPETLRNDYLNDEDEDGENELSLTSASRQEDIMKKIKKTIDPETYDGVKLTSSKVVGKIMETDIFDTLANSDRSAMRNIDQADVNKLTRFFASVRSKNKIYLDEEGDSIDPEAYIQFRSNTNMNEIFTNEDITQGLDVSIVIDLSGSMSSSFKLDLACKYAKTLYKALEPLPNVVLKAWVFSGYDLNKNPERLTPVIEVDYSRLDTIDTDWDRAPFTHTWNAITHVAYKMRGSSGKKLMIVISDGMPYDGADLVNGKLNSGYLGGRTSGSTRLPPNMFDCIKATRTAVEYSFLTGTSVYGIQISDSPKVYTHARSTAYKQEIDRHMIMMFGPRKNWTVVNSMEDAKHHLITEVVKGVYRTLVT